MLEIERIAEFLDEKLDGQVEVYPAEDVEDEHHPWSLPFTKVIDGQPVEIKWHFESDTKIIVMEFDLDDETWRARFVPAEIVRQLERERQDVESKARNDLQASGMRYELKVDDFFSGKAVQIHKKVVLPVEFSDHVIVRSGEDTYDTRVQDFSTDMNGMRHLRLVLECEFRPTLEEWLQDRELEKSVKFVERLQERKRKTSQFPLTLRPLRGGSPQQKSFAEKIRTVAVQNAATDELKTIMGNPECQHSRFWLDWHKKLTSRA